MIIQNIIDLLKIKLNKFYKKKKSVIQKITDFIIKVYNLKKNTTKQV